MYFVILLKYKFIIMKFIVNCGKNEEAYFAYN